MAQVLRMIYVHYIVTIAKGKGKCFLLEIFKNCLRKLAIKYGHDPNIAAKYFPTKVRNNLLCKR